MSDPILHYKHPQITPGSVIRKRIPLWLKLALTAFVAVMVPVYNNLYGPWNFLYFCDVAMFVTLLGVWIESPLLISMQAVAILVPQIFWIADFISHLLGYTLTGMTAYMFWPETPVIAFEISLFHIWLPALLLWLVQRVGYDRRAVWLQIPAGIVLILICYNCFAPPDSHGSTKVALNLNFVFGLPGYLDWPAHHPRRWVAYMIASIIILFYLPTHLILSKTLVKRPTVNTRSPPSTPPQSDAKLLPDAPLSR